ncbi:hypothetical protein Golax_009271, partial [Gossypium laxum]|nr:hypothetical protein [Gossypium laxum]
SVVNGGSHLSNFHSSSSSSSSNTIATHIEALSKKPMPVRGKGKIDYRFDNVDDALIFFNKMIGKYPKPSIVEFNKLLGAVVRMKHYAIVVSMYSVVTFSTLINGLCIQSKISEAISIFDGMTERGYQLDLIVYNTILKGLCKTGNTDRAVRFLRLMEGTGFEPDIVAYNTILDCLCKKGLLKEALNLFSEMKEATRLLNEMVDNNISLDIVTYTILIDALCTEGMISKAVEIVDTMRKQGIEPNVVTYTT